MTAMAASCPTASLPYLRLPAIWLAAQLSGNVIGSQCVGVVTLETDHTLYYPLFPTLLGNILDTALLVTPADGRLVPSNPHECPCLRAVADGRGGHLPGVSGSRGLRLVCVIIPVRGLTANAAMGHRPGTPPPKNNNRRVSPRGSPRPRGCPAEVEMSASMATVTRPAKWGRVRTGPAATARTADVLRPIMSHVRGSLKPTLQLTFDPGTECVHIERGNCDHGGQKLPSAVRLGGFGKRGMLEGAGVRVARRRARQRVPPPQRLRLVPENASILSLLPRTQRRAPVKTRPLLN
ncbi:hypothetical protein SKAU_G00302000 [Synaphobranchus kaupii]|uniref:Uncharacterized protein n=1 Tax=Synaphobranchus kaupii TaxID=118154 RepID=A0A9Q1EW17_SYNKA|nr:hypothetical protein SKAU_G00302000 [Synaphobranchus kaupii]